MLPGLQLMPGTSRLSGPEGVSLMRNMSRMSSLEQVMQMMGLGELQMEDGVTEDPSEFRNMTKIKGENNIT